MNNNSMLILRKLNLQHQFFLYFTGLTLVVVIIISATVYFFQRYTLREQADEKAINLTQILAHAGLNAMKLNDYIVVQIIIDGMMSSPDVLSVMILDSTGTIVAADEPERRGEKLDDLLTQTVMLSDKYKVEKIHIENIKEIWDTAFPIYELNKKIGIARIQYEVKDLFKNLFITILWIGIITIVLSLILSYMVSQSISKPIRNAVNLANEYGKGNFDAAVDNNRYDEIGQLVSSLNKLSDALKSMIEEKIANENLVMMGEFAAFIIHDLKNPISGIHLLAEGLNRKISDDHSLKKYSYEILLASQKLEDFIKRTLDIARPSGLITQPILINHLIDEVLNEINLNEIEVEKRFDKSITEIFGDYQLLFRAIKNIINNAIESIEFEGKIIIETKKEENLIIKITDNGTGIDENRTKTIFRPFYSSKREGHGLGLAMAKKAVLMHYGSIEVESKKGSGSIFTITLPAITKHHKNVFKQKIKE